MRRLPRIIIATLIFAGVTSLPVMAQNNDTPASESMKQAGQSLEQAASDTGSAAVDAYHGTARAVQDTTITAKVKLALHNDKEMGRQEIQIHTVGGVVTLNGDVQSQASAERAAQIAMQTAGVRSVNNQLRVTTNQGEEE